ncbi:hypothetical protein DXG01_006617 [Tephrocybe rancida]|nr:hypothetical protein DXG01_006617 [Tephrocybe rancida]
MKEGTTDDNSALRTPILDKSQYTTLNTITPDPRSSVQRLTKLAKMPLPDPPPRRSARLGSGPLIPAQPAPGPSPPRKRARAHDQPPTPAPSSPNPLTDPTQCTTTPRAIRAAKRRRLSGPTSPTITSILTSPLPLGSIAMPGSAALPMLPRKPSLHLRSPLSSPPPELEPTLPSPVRTRRKENSGLSPATTRRSPRQVGSADSRPRKTGVTPPQSVASSPSNASASANSSPAPKRVSTSPKRSRTLAVNVETDTPVAGPSHSTAAGASTLSANVTADGSTSTRRISPRRPGSTSTPASTSAPTPPKSKSTPATPTPKSRTPKAAPVSLPTKRKRSRPFKVHVDESVVESVLSAKGKGKENEVEEELGSPMRVDAEVQVEPLREIVVEPTKVETIEIAPEKAEGMLISPAKEEPTALDAAVVEDAKPIPHVEDAAIPLSTLPTPPPASIPLPMQPELLATTISPPPPQPQQPALHIEIPSHPQSLPHPQPQAYMYPYEASQPQEPYPEVHPQQFEQHMQQQQMQQQQQQMQQHPQPQMQMQQQQPQVQVQQSRHMRDSFMLWKTACRLRVEYLQRRYTPVTIRDLVAQEASDYFLKHGYPKPWSPVRVQRLDGASELDVEDFFEEAASAARSSSGEDWSDYESELSDEDEYEYDDEEVEGASGAEAGEKEGEPPRKRVKQDQQQEQDEEDDPDAEGDLDPEAYAHDPSFNAELSLSFSPKTRVREAAEGCMGAFYVPPSPVFDSPYSSDSEMDVDMTPGDGTNMVRDPPPHMDLDPENAPVLEHRDGSAGTPPPTPSFFRPVTYAPPATTTLPVPPPRLATIPVMHLRSAETGTIGLIGRGTPVDRARKAQWGWGVRPGANMEGEVRGRSRSGSRERGQGRGRNVGISRLVNGRGRREVLGDVGVPVPSVPAPVSPAMGPSMGMQPIAPDQTVWDAFFESLKRDGDASPPPVYPSTSPSPIQAPPTPPMLEIPRTPSPAPQSSASPPALDLLGMNMMGMGVNMNMNMNINMSMNMGMGMGMGALFSPSPSPSPSHSSGAASPTDHMPSSPADFEMFNVGFGVGVGVGLGMAVGSRWMAPPPSPVSPPGSPVMGDMGFGMGMGMGAGAFGMGAGVGEGFEQPSTSTLSFALG